MVKTKILIIEDEQSLAKIIRLALEEIGYDVVLAFSSEEGIQKARAVLPALIVLDILLPGKSGFECLKRLKAGKLTSRIPVIVLSNLGQDEEIRLGIKYGATDYLVKADSSIGEIVNKITKLADKNKK